MAKAVAQITIVDLNDPYISGTEPINPTENLMWLDTSVSPTQWRRWDGNKWETINDTSGISLINVDYQEGYPLFSSKTEDSSVDITVEGNSELVPSLTSNNYQGVYKCVNGNLISRNNNLFDIESFCNSPLNDGYYELDNGYLKVLKADARTQGNMFHLKLDAGTYTLSMNVIAGLIIRTIDETILVNKTDSNEYTFTLNNDDEIYIKFGVNNDKPFYITDIQLEKSNVKTEYKPFGYKSISLPNLFEYNGLKDTYKPLSGEYSQWVGYDLIPNTTTWTNWDSSNKRIALFSTQTSEIQFGSLSFNSLGIDQISTEDNNLPETTAIYWDPDYTQMGLDGTETIEIANNKLQEWLTINPVASLYNLPIQLKSNLTPDLLDSYQGYTEIFTDGNTKPNLKAYFNSSGWNKLYNYDENIENINNSLVDISSDNRITSSEKYQLKKEWDIIVAEKPTLIDQFDKYFIIDITTKVKYEEAYENLSGYISPLLENLEITEDINGNDLRSYLVNYYSEKASLQQAISDKAKDLADEAQNQADTATINAKTANDLLDDIADENKLTPSEKQQLNRTVQEIINEKSSIDSQAEVYNISVTEYNTYYNILHDYLYDTPGILSNLNEVTVIDDLFNINFDNYYTSRQTVLNNIASATKNFSETKKTEAISAAKTETETQIKNAKIEREAYINGIRDNLQGQIDGSITSWFYTVPPSISNEPYTTWTNNEEKNKHVNDLYYNTETGFCYRFSSSYSWVKISDSDIQSALDAASKAQDTADRKRRVFSTNKPTPPYDIDDLCINSDGDLLKCVNEKSKGELYLSTDWIVATKYTDDTAVDELEDRVVDTETTLVNIADDDKITPSEKQQLKKEWDIIAAEKTTIVSQADNYPTIADLKTNYIDAYDSLNSYIPPFLTNLTTTGSIVGSTLRDKLVNYYSTKAELQQAISDKAKDLADNAQSTADNAQEDIDSANLLLTELASEDKLTPSEKQQLDRVVKSIIKEKPSIISQANVYSISTTDLTNKYNTLYNYLYNTTNGILKDLTITTSIVTSTFTTNFDNYYTSKQTVLNNIASETKNFSETKKTEAINAAKIETETQIAAEAIKQKTYADAIKDDLQNQLDGSVSSWFYPVAPTTSNEPYTLWTTTDMKNNHLSDLYYDTETGFCYRFALESTIYKWERIIDSDLTAALKAASKAQDTADGKRRTFTITPFVPYDVSDLWINDDGDLLKCVNDKTENESYLLADWKIATKYTDDTAVDELEDRVVDTENSIVDIADDDKITPSEKIQLKKEWDIIVAEKPVIVSQADKYTTIKTLKTNYTNAYDSLNSYVPPFLTNLTTTGSIVGSTLRAKLVSYYSTKALLQQAISDKAKDLADSAQSQANTATANAATANGLLADIASDTKLTPSEKQQLDRVAKAIIKEKPSIVSQANVYSISTTDLTTKYSTLYNYLYNTTNGILKNLTTTTSIVTSTFTTNFDNYYTSKQTVLNNIASETKNYSETTKTEAINAAAEDATAKVAAEVTARTEYVDKIKNDLQGQIDGSITTWFYAVPPTLSNEPYTTWNTDEIKINHLKDLYYDTETGFCYRFIVTNSVYEWKIITDTDVTKALRDSADARKVADNKIRMFSTEPFVPYDIDDLWINSDRDLLKCVTARLEDGSYVSTDWKLATKYTDDTAVDELEIGGTNYASLTLWKDSIETWGGINTYILQRKLETNTNYTVFSNVPYNATTTLYFNGNDKESSEVYEGHPKTFNSGSDGELYLAMPKGRPHTNNILDGTYWVMFEKGKKFTGWVAAPEDVKADIKAVDTKVTANKTTIDQHSNSLKLTATKTEVTEQYGLAVSASKTYSNTINTKGIGMKVNYSSFTTSNPGELYIHGFDTDGNAADVNGFLIFNGEKITVNKQMINTDFEVPKSYIYWDNSVSIWYLAMYDAENDKWLRNGQTEFTLTSNHYFVGYAEMSSSESFTSAILWAGILDYKQVIALASVDNLKNRISSAEIKIEPDKIVSTVRGSSEYTDDLDAKTTADQVATAIAIGKSTNFGYRYHEDIIIYGDSDKYYPVVIKSGNQNVKRDILVMRGYSELAPSDWYTSTHKGSLTLKIKANFGGWGGASYAWEVHEFEEMYSNMFAGAVHLCCSFALFLRGGGTTGAKYHLYSDQSLSEPGYNTNGLIPPSPQICYDKDTYFYSSSSSTTTVYEYKAPDYRTLTDANKKEIADRKFIELAQKASSNIENIFNNNILTPSEKQQLKKEWDIIYAEKPNILISAENYSTIKTSKDSYVTAYNLLDDYIDSFLDDLSVNSTIDSTVLRTKLSNYYDAKSFLQQTITDKAKELADTAQEKADYLQNTFIPETLGSYSTIKQTNSSIESTVTEVKSYTNTAVNNVEIGGRNLIIIKDVTKEHYVNASGGISPDSSWFYTDYIDVSNYKSVIASGYTNLGSSPATCFYDIGKTYMSGINNNHIYSGIITEATMTLDKCHKMEIPKDAVYLRFSGMKADLGKIKLEKGNKSTDWTPAPEDVDASIAEKASNTDLSTANEKIDNSINSTIVQYYLSNSSLSSSSIDDDWNDEAPEWIDGKYMWSRTKIVYNNDDIAYKPSENGTCIAGAKGSTGNGISSTTISYGVNTSGITHPTSWVDDSEVPSTKPGEYLWTRTVIAYTAGNSSTSYSVAKHGNDGKDGKDGINGTDGANGINGTNGRDGLDGVGISSTAVSYVKSTSGTTTPGSGWDNNIPTINEGEYLWTRTIISYTNGDDSTSYSVAKFGESGVNGINGTDGVGIDSTAVSYAKSINGINAPSSGWDNNIPTVNEGEYLWTKTVISYTNGDDSTSYSVAKFGDKGSTGNGIKSTTISYGVNTSGTTHPTSWSNSLQSTSPSQYLWTKTVIAYTAGDDSTSYSVAKHGTTGATGAKGDKGDTGNGIKSTTISYGVNTSGTTHPTSWSNSLQSTSPGQYLWTKTVIAYTAGDDSTSYSVAKHGNDGKDGTNGINGSDGANGINGTNGNDGLDGVGISSTAVTYAKSLSGITTPTSTSFTANIPTVNEGEYLWTKTTLHYTNGENIESFSIAKFGESGTNGTNGVGISSTAVTYAKSLSGITTPTSTSFTANIPTVNEGEYLWTKTFITYTNNKTSTAFSVGKFGAKGTTGAKGSTGATGRGISSIVEQYYVSTSKTSQIDGSWSTASPVWSYGKYVWTRSYITYTSGNPTTSTTTPVVSSEWEAVNEVETIGMNLVLDSDTKINSSSYLMNTYEISKEWKYGEKYTMSIQGTLNSDEQEFSLWLNGSSSNAGYFTYNTTKEIYELSFTETINVLDNYKNKFSIYNYPSTGSGTSTIYKIKLEKGTKATDWTAAPEDIDDDIKVAQDDATKALSDLSDMSSDTKLTPVEKLKLKVEWDKIIAEKNTNDSLATTFGIVTEKSTYNTYYNTLNTYLGTLLSNLTTTSTIVATTFRNNFKNYYDKRQLLLNAISTKSKSLANTAQNTADSKRRTFTTTPVSPYDKDDLWINDDGDILKCVTSTTKGESYLSEHWKIATKYTDDTAVYAGRNLIIIKDINDGYLNNLDSISSDSTWFYTDYINVSNCSHVIASGYSDLGSNPSTCFYNSSKTFLSGINNRSNIAEVPENAYYLRFSGVKADLEKIKLEKGTIATDWTYSPEDLAGNMKTLKTSITKNTSVIKTQSEEITTTIGEYNTEIDNVISYYKVPPNLLKNTSFKPVEPVDPDATIFEVEGWEARQTDYSISLSEKNDDYNIIKITNTSINISPDINAKGIVGEFISTESYDYEATYILSLDIKTDADCNIYAALLASNKIDNDTIIDLNTNYEENELTATDDTKRIKFIFERNENMSKIIKHIGFYINAVTSIYISKVKLEKNYLNNYEETQWIPSIEDEIEHLDLFTAVTTRTNQVISEFQKNLKSFKFDVSNSGGFNMINNSTGINGFNFWTLNGVEISGNEATGFDYTVNAVESGADLGNNTNSLHAFKISNNKTLNDTDLDNITGQTDKSLITQSPIKVNPNTTYYFKCRICITSDEIYTPNLNAGNLELCIDESNSNDYSDSTPYSFILDQYTYSNSDKLLEKATNTWVSSSVSFTTGSDTSYIYLGYRMNLMDKNSIAYIADSMLVSGNIEKEWTPGPNEIYGSQVLIDQQGIKVYQYNEDGNESTYTLIDNDEFAVKNAETSETLLRVSDDKTELTNTEIKSGSNLNVSGLKFTPVMSSSNTVLGVDVTLDI